MRGQERKPHDARVAAESFGADPARYDRVRPSYPTAMVDAIVAQLPGNDVLDVGCGTGIAARLFQDAGCRVLGVEVDPRMAAFARGRGLDVEVAPFEAWDRGGRTFDGVISATTWHWIDPRAGAARAAEALHAGGVLALFWNVQHVPSPLAEAFRAVHERITPGSLFARSSARSHTRILDRAARGVRDTDAFDAPRVRRFSWQQPYTREQWLELVPTFGGHHLLAPDRLDELLAGLGDAIDVHGGAFTMDYETLLFTARRA